MVENPNNGTPSNARCVQWLQFSGSLFKAGRMGILGAWLFVNINGRNLQKVFDSGGLETPSSCFYKYQVSFHIVTQ